MIFRYRLMHFPPSWSNNRELAEYDFHLSAIQNVVNNHLRHYQKFPVLLQHPAQVEEREKLRLLQQKLEQLSSGEQKFIVWSHGENDGVWWFLDAVALDGDWEKVRCLECDALYQFDECRIENWSVGESLFAEGGRELFCPRRHLLCHAREWNS